MYTSFFGLSEKPFAITPDPRYLYLSGRHAEALAHLLYGINEAGGFVQLTGEVGTGKTTIVRTLLSRLPQHADVAVILNPGVTPTEFLQSICEELGIIVADADRHSIKHLVDALYRRLLSAHAAGRRVILIVDEAQNLPPDVLENLRMLTNLETPSHKLLQIILIGQPELRELLARNDLRQLAQRVTGRYHLSPLDRAETLGYVRHRLGVAGAPQDIFSDRALAEVHRLSSGIPRVINVCCDRALLGAYTRETRKIGAALVRRAAGEVYGRRFTAAWVGWLTGAGVALALCALTAFAVWRTWFAPGAAPPRRAVTEFHAAPIPAAGPPTPAPTPAPMRAPHAAPLPKPAASISSLLDSLPADGAGVDAWRRLFALWRTAFAGAQEPCAQAAQAGLACLTRRGSWAELRILDRPAILTLVDDRGEPHAVLLTTLTDQAATLTLDGRPQTVTLEELSKVWFGDFTVIWRPHTRHVRDLAEGMRGPAVAWLRRSLDALGGSADDPARADVYDHRLTLAVENFQKLKRLNVDGIAGAETQVALDAALADPKSPLLLPTARRGR